MNAEKRPHEYSLWAKQHSEAEDVCQSGLNEEMRRLEKMNPVGPRTSVPLVSDERLKREIAAGEPIWQARRDHRSRERAARFRQKGAKRVPAPSSQPNPLLDVDPAEGGEILDEAFAASARANLAEFRQVLKEKAKKEKKQKKRH